MSEEKYVIINALLYIALFLFYRHRHKGLTPGLYVIGLWMACSIVGVLYEPVNFIGHMRKITLWPYLYLFFCACMMFLPITNFKGNRIQSIGVNDRLLIPLGFVIGLIALPPFIESSIYYLQNHGNLELMLQAFNDRYEDASTTYNYLSTLSRRLTYILHAIRTLILFMLVYMPTIHNRSKTFKLSYIGVCLSAIMIVLESLILLSRFQIVIYALYAFFIFIVVRNVYSDALKKKSKKVMLTVGALFVVLEIAQTASRYLNYTENLGQQEVGTMAYLGQYAGESMGNFNGDIVHSQYRLNSDPISSTYLDFLGVEGEPSHYAENRFPSNLFFTVVGEYWRSYGGTVTLILFIIVPLFINFILKNSRYRNISFAMLTFFFMYSKIAIVGIFYNAYFVDKNELLVMPLFMWILTSHKKRTYLSRR